MGEAAEIVLIQTSPKPENANANGETDNCTEFDPKSELKMKNLVDMLSNLKLNPMAKEFFPSCFNNQNRDLLLVPNFAPANEHFGYDGFFDNKRRKKKFNHGRRRFNGRASRAQREDSIRRTVYVSEIDQSVTEERLAALFSSCGQVVDCRICGDPHSRLRFAFVEFANDRSAREAINFSGTIIGFYPIKVLPSKTAILPVNPTFLPQSEDEREMCARTVYCTNIDKQITQAEVKLFFESCCGVVSRLRLLGDNSHSTRIAFVEFVMAESAIAALDCSGRLLGAQPIRVSPSKTPVRPRVLRHPQN